MIPFLLFTIPAFTAFVIQVQAYRLILWIRELSDEFDRTCSRTEHWFADTGREATVEPWYYRDASRPVR